MHEGFYRGEHLYDFLYAFLYTELFKNIYYLNRNNLLPGQYLFTLTRRPLLTMETPLSPVPLKMYLISE